MQNMGFEPDFRLGSQPPRRPETLEESDVADHFSAFLLQESPYAYVKAREPAACTRDVFLMRKEHRALCFLLRF